MKMSKNLLAPCPPCPPPENILIVISCEEVTFLAYLTIRLIKYC